MTANNRGNGTAISGGYWTVTYAHSDVKTTLYLRKGGNNMIGSELPKPIAPKAVFHKLTVVKKLGAHPSGVVLWLCKCACGALVGVPELKLAGGVTTSCGCEQRRAAGHGATKQFSWQGTKGAR